MAEDESRLRASSLTDSRDNVWDRLNAAQTMLQGRDREVKLAAEIGSLLLNQRNELEASNQMDADHLQAELHHSSAIVEGLRHELKELRRFKAYASGLLEESDFCNQSLMSQVDSMQQRAALLQQELVEKNLTIHELEVELLDRTKECDKLRKKVREKTMQFEESQVQLQNASEDIQMLEDEVEGMQQELENSELEIERLHREIEAEITFEEIVRQQEQQLERIGASRALAERERDQYRQVYQETLATLTSVQKQIPSVEIVERISDYIPPAELSVADSLFTELSPLLLQTPFSAKRPTADASTSPVSSSRISDEISIPAMVSSFPAVMPISLVSASVENARGETELKSEMPLQPESAIANMVSRAVDDSGVVRAVYESVPLDGRQSIAAVQSGSRHSLPTRLGEAPQPLDQSLRSPPRPISERTLGRTVSPYVDRSAVRRSTAEKDPGMFPESSDRLESRAHASSVVSRVEVAGVFQRDAETVSVLRERAASERFDVTRSPPPRERVSSTGGDWIHRDCGPSAIADLASGKISGEKSAASATVNLSDASNHAPVTSTYTGPPKIRIITNAAMMERQDIADADICIWVKSPINPEIIRGHLYERLAPVPVGGAEIFDRGSRLRELSSGAFPPDDFKRWSWHTSGQRNSRREGATPDLGLSRLRRQHSDETDTAPPRDFARDPENRAGGARDAGGVGRAARCASVPIRSYKMLSLREEKIQPTKEPTKPVPPKPPLSQFSMGMPGPGPSVFSSRPLPSAPARDETETRIEFPPRATPDSKAVKLLDAAPIMSPQITDKIPNRIFESPAASSPKIDLKKSPTVASMSPAKSDVSTPINNRQPLPPPPRQSHEDKLSFSDESSIADTPAPRSQNESSLTDRSLMSRMLSLARNVASFKSGKGPAMVPKHMWVPDHFEVECRLCGEAFSTFNRRHHCRSCGHLFCAACAKKKIHLAVSNPAGGLVERYQKERVCYACLVIWENQKASVVSPDAFVNLPMHREEGGDDSRSVSSFVSTPRAGKFI